MFPISQVALPQKVDKECDHIECRNLKWKICCKAQGCTKSCTHLSCCIKMAQKGCQKCISCQLGCCQAHCVWHHCCKHDCKKPRGGIQVPCCYDGMCIQCQMQHIGDN